jgi:hypothetical protein
MARSQAQLGYGTVLEIALASAPTVFTYIAETTSHNPPSFTDATVEVTHMQSPNRSREYIAGLTDTGESTHEMNFVPGSATDAFLLASRGLALIARLTFTNGKSMVYNCVRSGYERGIVIDDRMTATLTLKVSGDPTMVVQAAPRNLAVPTISGTAVVGSPLICDQGLWAGATDIEYQWQAAGADIVGAVAPSYVPVTGDIGDTITCEVTGVNSGFSTMAESAATAAVA